MQPRPGDTLVVAGLWVRAMAQSARRAGWRVIALDLFGDRDTRAEARAWRRIGDAARFEIDPERLATELDGASRSPDVIGWVAGSGFEAQPAWLDLAPGLPRLGMSSADVAALRDPLRWFATLDALALPHPPVAWRHGPGTLGWLLKHGGGSGGWHIRESRPQDGQLPLPAGTVLQQRVAGASMSVLFLADGERARRVAISRQDVRALGEHPFVYHGACGPVRDPALEAAADHALAALAPACGLRGLASADFIATEQGPLWLEINPRPSATMLLYDDLLPRGLMHAHVQACAGTLPAAPRQAADLRGHRVVHAPAPVEVDAVLSDALAARRRCHDLPTPQARVGKGEPLCSVSAQAATDADLHAALERERLGVLARVAQAAASATTPGAVAPSPRQRDTMTP